MKTLLNLITCIALILSLQAGCKKTPKPDLPAPQEEEASPEETLLPPPPEGTYNVFGRVVDASTQKGISGVVVSDGQRCIQTRSDGSFYMKSNTYLARFIFVSTPSAYMPPVEGGIPKFYKPLSSLTPVDGIYDAGVFSLSPVENPTRFTLLISADPQPRAGGARYDKFAYHSLEICEDLYKELAEVASGIGDRQVYGFCLGDLVHENMSLFDNYAAGLATLGYPTYNIIGNHDNDTSAADDDASAKPFEDHFGPRNYSLNIGGIHFVVLDNLIMKSGSSGKLNAYDQGLTDEIWAWLQSDLSFIPSTSKLMVFSHSPMFKCDTGSERTNTARHGPDYGDRINDYAEIHAWAGHTHASFNYIYPSSHRHSRVQVHTVARSTGELWTNEYLASGTPRGFTIVDVDQGEVSWRFHPTRYQRPSWVGLSTNATSAEPAYRWRDWTYDESTGLAWMKDGGTLDEDYQLHVYPRGAYGDNHVYANIFLWDEKWQVPVFTPEGGAPVSMERVTTEDRHDLATTEFRTHYKTYTPTLHDDDGYTASSTGVLNTLFRTPVAATVKGGTVSVTDRFGHTYSRSVSW